MISILLATYNGQKFIAEQLDSLINQTFQDFIIYIKDDDSDDGTRDIIHRYVRLYPQKIRLLNQESPSGSAKANFMRLLSDSTIMSDYYMLCDQDDVWFPDKIQKSLDAIRKLEQTHGKETPLLVHTDLKVVNEHLESICVSFVKYQGLKPKKKKLPHLLIQNNITGCTTLFNASLRNISSLVNVEQIIMHDWWLGLAAAAFGYISFINDQTIFYRQHPKNQIGAKSFLDIKYIIKQVKQKMINQSKYRQTSAQAKAFQNVFHDKLSLVQQEILTNYIKLTECKSKFIRWHIIIRYRFYMQGAFRIIAQFFFG